MKLSRFMLAMMLCAGLLFAVGMTGCGDDDDNDVDCAKALAQIQVEDCVDGVTTGIDEFRTCMTNCEGDPTCEDGCEVDFSAAAEPCEPAASILDEDCGCQVCGNNFDSCVADLERPAADCVSGEVGIISCLTDCVTL